MQTAKKDTKQVIIVRKDLKMRKGKMVAQGAHASLKAILDRSSIKNPESNALVIEMTPEMKDWIGGIFTKICVSVNSEQELLDVYQKAQNAGLICSLIQDAGLTEFGGVPTYTAVAIGPANSKDINKITGLLKLL